MAPKGVSNRTLLAKRKGIKVGQTIVVQYREEGKGASCKYEGVLADRRIGGTDRESYIEIKNCKMIGSANEIIAHEGTKRLVDAFIDDMDITEPRVEEPTPAPNTSSGGYEMLSGTSGPQGMGMGMGMMPMGMGGMGGMGMGGMGGMGTGMMPMGMGMMPMGMGMMPFMGMGAMMPQMAAMQMAAMNEAGGAKSSSAPARDGLQLGRAPDHSPEDIAFTLEGIEEGEHISVAYTHPKLGKTKYQGILDEKYTGASNLQSYIQLRKCQRLSSRGHVREEEPTKRLMTAFIDEVSVINPIAQGRHNQDRSRSPRQQDASSARAGWRGGDER